MNCRVSVDMAYDETSCVASVGFSAPGEITDGTITFSRDEFKELMDNILAENQNRATMTHWQIIVE